MKVPDGGGHPETPCLQAFQMPCEGEGKILKSLRAHMRTYFNGSSTHSEEYRLSSNSRYFNSTNRLFNTSDARI